ncbi:MAG: PspC domain-containing protein [Gammaproteobacteria bacterium]
MNISDEIKRLHDLHLAGALTAAEFEQAKAKLLRDEARIHEGVDLNKPGAQTHHGQQGYTAMGNLGDELQKLRRSRSDRWLGGVCGGLAVFTHTEAWIWRLLFALFVLTFGFSAAVYLLLWILVPEE